ncbi:MAG: carbohydrate porin [Elusimicrobiota bacterium]|jgi:hypothetical protein|nr:carbohydrate porin [Elusimicrobiota bacterium]
MSKRIISINLILFSLFLGKCGFAGISENTTDLEPAFMRNYAEVKETIQDKTGISFGLNISYMPQRLAPNGKKTAWQDIYSPSIEWKLFEDMSLGSGSLSFNDIYTHYWAMEASELEEKANVANSINNYTQNANLFYKLTYTHTLSGALDWISLGAGQFSLFDFEGGIYTNDQQLGLINFAMSQNPTNTYPLASFGAYLTLSPKVPFEITAGYQDANNISGKDLQIDTIFNGNYLAFISVEYSPQFEKFGEGAYAFLTYYQPAVEEQDQYSWGWSLNTEQHLSDKWLILLRASGGENTLNALKQSYMAAVGYKNPLNRNPVDAVIFGIAYNRIEKSNLEDFALDAGESAYELQWIWGISRWLTITPDMQFYPRAAFNSDTNTVLVSGIRFTFML